MFQFKKSGKIIEIKNQKKYNWFTLVELIVVITILSILGTIGFISIQGYSSSARDSTRISNLVNLHKGLDIYRISSWIYPMPENSITITASGVITEYQGFAKEQIANIAKLSAGATKDPLDNWISTTYATNELQTKMQLMVFLEDGSKVTSLISNPLFASESFANASTNYSNRIPMSRWDSIGILLGTDSNLNQPVQELYFANSFTGVDIIQTTKAYTMYLNKSQQFSGTGTALKSSIAGDGLVGYWSFDEWNGTTVTDSSWNENNGIFSGGISPTWTTGKVGGWLSFYSNSWATSASWWFVEFWMLKNMIQTWKWTPHTITSWMYIPRMLCTDSNECRQWVLLLGSPWTWSHHWLIWGLHWPSQFWVWSWPQVNVQYDIWKWVFMAVTFDGTNLIRYIDDKKIPANTNWGSTDNFNLKDSSFSIWWKIQEASYDGLIDEVRVYSRALTESEIWILYNSSK